MNDGNGWYHGQRAQHSYAGQQQPPQGTDPRQTLASYPFVATTPTSHVARHLNSLTIQPSSMHTFTRPAFYQQHHAEYSGNPPPYVEYNQNPHLVAPSHIPSAPNQSWQAHPQLQYHATIPQHVQQPTHWQSGMQQYSQPYHNPASSSLAHALGPPMSVTTHSSSSSSSLQHTFVESKRPQATSRTYSTESSLSGALGALSEPHQPAVSILAPPALKRHTASESAAFLDDLLAREGQNSSDSYSQPPLPRTPQRTSVTSQGSPVKGHGSQSIRPLRDYPPHQNQHQHQHQHQHQQQQQQHHHSLPTASHRPLQQFQQVHRADSAPQPRALHEQVHMSDASSSIPSAPVPIPPFRVPKRIQEPESPDPLALDMGPTYSSPGAVTPRKRKPVDPLESPSKRMQSPLKKDSSQSSSTLVTPPKADKIRSTPSTSRSSLPSTTPSTQGSFKTPSTGSTVKHVPYVELPRLPKDWLTPVKKSKTSTTMLSGGDLGGYGSESGEETPLSKQLLSSAQRSLLKSSGKKTGDRDDRAPLEKFIELLEDVFEAEDNLPSDADASADPSSRLFSSLTSDWSRPLLAPTVVRKLATIVGKVARPPKRDRLTMGARDSPRKAPRGLAEMDTQMLGRVLKMLERSVRAGKDLDPFAGPPAGPGTVVAPSAGVSPSKKSPSKKKRARSTSRTPQEESVVDETVQGIDVDFDKLDRALEIAKEAVIAADCVIALLSADKLSKQLYSEELITACLSTVKNLLDKIIYPFVEANNDLHGQSSLILLHVARDSGSTANTRRALIGEIFHSLSSVFPRINALIGRSGVSMSDKIIIQSVFIAIGPFFVVEFGTEGSKAAKEKTASIVLNALGGTAALRGLRLSALALIRSIFANHSDQRSWIIEEILTSLIKLPDLKQKAGQFRLRDGRSIHTVSALLLQLVQTSAHDVRIEARKLALGRQQSAVLKRHDSGFNEGNEVFLTDRDREEIALYTNGLDSATKAAKTIVVFLTQRAGKGKNTKNTNEAEYRAIFDNLISDLLAVIFWPEWPSASLLLDIICKFMVASLDDVKTASTNDSNGAKASALDHLGTVAARLRTSILKFSHNETVRSKDTHLRPLEEVVTKLDVGLLDRLVAVHDDITNHLAKRASEDQAYDSAQELTAASWGHEIAVLLPRCENMLKSMTEEGGGSKSEQVKITEIVQKMKSAMRAVWKSASNDVFDVGTEEEVTRVDRLAEEVGTIQGLKNAFDPILAVVLAALDSPAVFMRSKALRALGHIVTSDPDILRNPKVRAAIEGHLLDSSPAVRDAAVELIGKYIIQLPEVAADYYQRIADRIADTGLGVRKRVIKLLKTLYLTSNDSARQIDICSKLVLRQLDEDDTVKDLATKTIEELWFSDGGDGVGKSKSTLDPRAALLSKANVIMNVTGVFKDRQIPLEDLLHRIVSEKEGKDASSIHARYTEICDVLIEGLVDSQDFTDFNVVYCIKTVYLFSAAHPGVISFSKAATLLPYLKNPSNPEEQLISDYLLKIFRVSLPLMPKTAAKFGAELQLTLQPMIVKPSPSGGLSSLQETVACMCSVVQYLTHDYIRLVGLLKSCNAKVQEFLKKPTDTSPASLRPLSILIFIVSLLTEHCDFDRVRRENSALATDLDMVSKDSVSLHVYNCLLALYRKLPDGSMRPRLLQCLGFLFRAYPTFMTLESSAEMMDAIFASPEEDVRGRLLKIIQDFLISESLKNSAREKESKSKDATAVNMDKLVGNTNDFAESGVAAAIVQRYLPQILEASVAKHTQVQTSAMDILTFTIKQGLAHPLQCLPTIVALETSPNTLLSARANALHAVLHSKHASLVTTRYVECARKSFEYQIQMCDGAVCGFRSQPTISLFHRWYSLVREKRAARQDFLKAIVRVFDVDTATLSSKQDDVDFARYMAENVATLDYKTQEEVLTVLRHLTSILSVAGTAIVEVISPSHLLRQLQSDSADAVMDIDASYGLNSSDPFALARVSSIITMILLLKSHLKTLYTISEEKVLKWIPGKKSAVGDKPAVRRSDAAITWDRIPFARQPILSSDDAVAQYKCFLTLWNEDGTMREPIEDLE